MESFLAHAHRLRRLALAAVALFVLASCHGCAPQQSERVRLGLNWKAEPEFGGFYAAQVRGLYQARGLDVEIIEGAANAPVLPMVAAGQLDFGIATGPEVLAARQRGADIVALFSVYQKSPNCLMVRASSGIRSIAELMRSGFDVAVGPGQLYVEFLQRKYHPVNVRWVPYLGGVSGLLGNPRHAQQCFVGSEPELARTRGMPTRVFVVADEGVDNISALLVTRGQLLRENPELVQRMLAAIRLGWQDYLNDPAPTHSLIARLNPAMSLPILDTMLREQRPFMLGDASDFERLGRLEPAMWERLQRHMLEFGSLEKPIDLRFAYRQDP